MVPVAVLFEKDGGWGDVRGLSLLLPMGVEKNGGGEMCAGWSVIGQSEEDGLHSDWWSIFAGQKEVRC